MFFELSRRGNNEWWAWVLTPILIVVGYGIGQLPMMGVMFSKMSNNPDLGMEELENFTTNPDFTIFDINSNIGFILMILMFVGSMIGLWIGIRFLHKRFF